jgi:Zn finger protein HypA/HybF involved in hydrogenase expression
MDLDRETVRAMLEQALAETHSRGAHRVTVLHLTLYDQSGEAEQALRNVLAEFSVGTPAEGAQIVTRWALSKFVCWNCCGLCFESEETDPICPNCGEAGLLLPPDVVFALERIEIA